MNILFVMYGDFRSNSANPLALYARELQSYGHHCVVAVPSGLETVDVHEQPAFRPALYSDVLVAPHAVFPDGRPADVIHACTPRDVVRQFIASYMAIRPTPLVVYLEDNERWISSRAAGMDETSLLGFTENEIAERLPPGHAHPLLYEYFIGLADVAAVIQDKLRVEVPPWVPCETVTIGIDVDFFSPRPPDPRLREKYGVADDEKVIVYHGGLNGFTKPAIETLCRAVGLINQQGYPCRLLRSGPYDLDFLGQLPPQTASAVSDLGVLPRRELPALLALADAFVQPGRNDPFEDLRLPGKLPEFLAMGRPVIMPDVNIANWFRDGVDALLMRDGSADEIAEKCISLFSDAQRADQIGEAGRILATKFFDVRNQARRLEAVYQNACSGFMPEIASKIWKMQIEGYPLQSIVAHKLRLMAQSARAGAGPDADEMLKEHARYMEWMLRRVQSLEATIVDRDIGLTRIAADMEWMLRRVQSLEATIVDRDIGLTRIAAERDAMAIAMQEVYASTSWRWSSPIRTLGRSFARIMRAVSLVQGAIRVDGGAWPLLKKAGFVARSEGLRGFVARIKFYRRRVGMQMGSNFAPDSQRDQLAYARYIDAMEPKPVALASMKKIQESFDYRPKFSIVVPVYNVEEKWLRRFIESVRAQAYPNWELCIADDCSTAPHIRPLLNLFAESDPRIRVKFRAANGHISAATNTALELATGDFMCLMDNDDEIAPHALYEFAYALNQNSQIDMIYSDEDKIDGNGRRFDPFFKPDWSPETLEGCMYTAHFACYKMSIVRELAGFRADYDGAQDYDFVLRFTERTKNIVHLPKVLYHWRAISGSAAATSDAKGYALNAAVSALQERAVRAGGVGEARVGPYPGSFDVRYVIQGKPLVSVIIPTAGRDALVRGKQTDLLVSVVRSIHEKNAYQNFEIVVVDNNDLRRETVEALSPYNCRFVHYSGPFNIAAKMNLGATVARGDYLLFMNDDVEAIDAHWMECMLQLAQRDGVGVVGAKLHFEDGRIQHVGVAFWNGLPDHICRGSDGADPGYFFSSCANRNYLAVTGAVMMTRKKVFEDVRGFDEALPINFNDVDYCLKVFQSGLRIVFAAGAQLYHYESASRKREVAAGEIKLFQNRWRTLVSRDPYYPIHFEDHPPNFQLRNDWEPVAAVR